MACVTPLYAHRGEGGSVVFSGKGYRDLPLVLPCGRCVCCIAEKARMWAIRCSHEAALHERSCFITLTYAPEHLPQDGSLVPRDLQLFWKRLREWFARVDGRKLRYFACGEYGPRTYRPHYHALVFGVDFHEDRYEVKRNVNGDILFRSPCLEKLWGMGYAPIGSVTTRSARYVAQYVQKKAVGPEGFASPKYRRLDPVSGREWYVEPEFSVMSRRPGIGRGWYDKFHTDLFPSDEFVHEGRRSKVPRYYDKILEARSPDAYLSVKARRRARVLEKASDYTEDRLRAKEALAISRLTQRVTDPMV